MYVLLSTSTIGGPITFANAQAWSIREGGWGDDVKWIVGDFDGDSRADLGAIWNNGDNAIAVRRSTGSSFTLGLSAIHMGGWMSQTKWLAGDFNGDGLSDIAAAWQYGNAAKVAVYTSTGLASNSFFTGWNQWDEWGNGWIDDANWVASDFNGDGKCDLGAAWNYYENNALTVRLSVTPTGSQLATSFAYPAHWLYPAGGWIPSTQWCAGAFRP